MSSTQKEYIVTLKNYEDLAQFYADMEEESNLPHIPNRSVTCVHKRPLSRNTHYLLTDPEAKDLRNDPRIELVNIKIKNLVVNRNSEQTSTWSRGLDILVGQKNYGLYRCRLDDNIPGWGSESGNNFQNATIKITSTGKNVDVIVVDDSLYPNHYEYNGRAIQYDWFANHDLAVKGTGCSIIFVSRLSNIARITTQTAHGLDVGSVINVTCTNNTSFNSSSVEVSDIISTTEFEYINSGVDVSTTSEIGTCTGLYQYGSYFGDNNHATHVAGILAGNTQGWARDANIYNLRFESTPLNLGSYCPPELLMDYIREFHATKNINPLTGRKNPTIVNCSWGYGIAVDNLFNQYTGFQYPRFSRLSYRGSFVTPAAAEVDTGFSGVYTSNAKIVDFNSTQPSSGNRILTDPDIISGNPNFGTVTPITFVDTGGIGLSDVGSPTNFDPLGIDSQDDANWDISLPFPIKYLTQQYNNIFVSSNSYITFGNGSLFYIMGTQSPALRKICISAGDRNCNAVLTGTFGSSPNRTFVIRWEGYDGAYGGVYEPSVNMIWEATFYEATPEQIDIHVISNACYRSEFTTSELSSYGLNLSGPLAPLRETSIDADIEDAINEGIIFVGAAGNSSTKIDISTGLDYNNYIIDNGLPIYFHRGSTPGASATVLCVGNADSTNQENKASSSNTGPRVDIYAPGSNIISSVHDKTGSLTGSVGLEEFTIDGGYAGSGSILAQAGRAAIVTSSPHGLSNGDSITIDNCSQTAYNVVNVQITVIDGVSFSFDISDQTYTSVLEILTGTVKAYGVYQKYSGTSMSSPQVAGMLALALETYPWMTQSDARNYILSYSKENAMFNSGGGYIDSFSLQGGNNKFAYYHRERPDNGILIPKSKQWIRPTTGMVFPRPQIRKK